MRAPLGFIPLTPWRQGSRPENWAVRAQAVLLKKLRKSKREGAEEELVRALTSKSPYSKCVTIPRSADGRLQVSHHKGLPHVIYCQVYRWPDLQSRHELKSLDCCKYPFEAKCKDVCINPYHYERVEWSGVLPPIVVPRSSETALQSATYSQHGFKKPPTISTAGQEGIPCTDMGSISWPAIVPVPSPSNATLPILGEDVFDHLDTVDVQYFEPGTWCSIKYFELNRRVGEEFHAKSPDVFVDGFTKPSSQNDNRFCLGQLSNVNRTLAMESVRRHIGNGVHLYHSESEQEVWAECRSDSPIFVESRNYNVHHGFIPTTVCKILPGDQLKIFSFKEFYNQLKECVPLGYEAVYDMTKTCAIRMSFVKGWGANYHRWDVTSTPCWIEIQIHGALEWLDKVLVEMKPSGQISSVT